MLAESSDEFPLPPSNIDHNVELVENVLNFSLQLPLRMDVQQRYVQIRALVMLRLRSIDTGGFLGPVPHMLE